MQTFIDGCGVEYVHWIPVPKHKHKTVPICETPLLAAKSMGSTRIRKALLRNRIETWDRLTAVTSKEFQEWRNYGEHSHAILTAIASENGYLIQPMR